MGKRGKREKRVKKKAGQREKKGQREKGRTRTRPKAQGPRSKSSEVKCCCSCLERCVPPYAAARFGRPQPIQMHICRRSLLDPTSSSAARPCKGTANAPRQLECVLPNSQPRAPQLRCTSAQVRSNFRCHRVSNCEKVLDLQYNPKSVSGVCEVAECSGALCVSIRRNVRKKLRADVQLLFQKIRVTGGLREN